MKADLLMLCGIKQIVQHAILSAWRMANMQRICVHRRAGARHS